MPETLARVARIFPQSVLIVIFLDDMLLWQRYALSIEFRRVRCPEGLSTVGLFVICSANATIGV